MVHGPLILMKKGTRLVKMEKLLVLNNFVSHLEKNALSLRSCSFKKLMKAMMITKKLNFQVTSILHIKMV